METIAAWLSVAAGITLLTWSIGIVGVANPGRRVPYWTKAERTPGVSILLRVLGVIFLVVGIGVMSATLGYWTVAVVIVAFIPGTVLITLHNQRLPSHE